MNPQRVTKLVSLNPRRFELITLEKAIKDYAYYVKCYVAWQITKNVGIELSKVEPKTFDEWRETEI